MEREIFISHRKDGSVYRRFWTEGGVSYEEDETLFEASKEEQMEQKAESDPVARYWMERFRALQQGISDVRT